MRDFAAARRIVIKVGTSTLTHSTGLINIRRVEELVKVLADLQNAGKEVVFVTSGAIGVGVGKLGLPKRPSDIPSKQACAAIGQCELMYLYDKLFSEYNHNVAQVLLTGDIMENETRKQYVMDTFSRLLDYRVIPIVNENDTVAVDEIVIGDNDTLSAMVATLVDADLLILMSDIDGLYDSNPRENPNAKRIARVEEINDETHAIAGTAGSSRGTGGMATKINAAEIATAAGIDMLIVNGEQPQVLYDVFDNAEVGTHFVGRRK